MVDPDVVHRSSRRYIVRFPIELSDGTEEFVLGVSDNVSAGGVLIHCPANLSQTDSVQARCRLPMGIGDIQIPGEIMRVVSTATDTPLGKSYGIIWKDDDQNGALKKWLGFLDLLQECYGQIGETTSSGGLTPSRDGGRYVADLNVRLKSVDELKDIGLGDVSRSGMFLISRRNFVIGDLLRLDVVHPLSGERFELCAAVRWRGEKNHQAGVGVEFIELDDTRLIAFADFVDSEIAASPASQS